MILQQPETHSASAWADRYERLRQHALGGLPPAAEWLLGLDVLLQMGVAVWMRVVLTSEARLEKTSLPPSGWLAASQKETVLVLVQMALAQFVQPNRRN